MSAESPVTSIAEELAYDGRGELCRLDAERILDRLAVDGWAVVRGEELDGLRKFYADALRSARPLPNLYRSLAGEGE